MKNEKNFDGKKHRTGVSLIMFDIERYTKNNSTDGSTRGFNINIHQERGETVEIFLAA